MTSESPQTLTDPDPLIVDAHVHIFNARDIPIFKALGKIIVAQLHEFIYDILQIPLQLLQEKAERLPDEELELTKILQSSEIAAPDCKEAIPSMEQQAIENFAIAIRKRLPDDSVLLKNPHAATPDDIDEALRQLQQSHLKELEEWILEIGEIPGTETLLEKDRNPIRWIRENIVGGVARILQAFWLVAHRRSEIACRLANTYSKNMLYIATLLDFEVRAGPPLTPYRKQIPIHSSISELSMQGRLPGAANVRIHSFVGFDPFRDIQEPRGASMNIVKNAIEKEGFIGVKVYNPTGFLPTGNEAEKLPHGKDIDDSLHALYEYCVRMDVPILAHANDSNSFKKGYGKYAGPDGWKRVLEKKEYSSLRICFGHFDHLTILKDPSDRGPLWADLFLSLMDDYENVYADISNSAVVYNKKYRKEYLNFLKCRFAKQKNPGERQRKLVYGSDWWMNTLHANHEKFCSEFQKILKEDLKEFPPDLFFSKNALRYLGVINQQDAPDYDNQNRKRLEAFYGNLEPPVWLPPKPTVPPAISGPIRPNCR